MKSRSFLLSALLFTLIMVPQGLLGQGFIPQTTLEESIPAEEDSVVLRPFPSTRITEAFAASGNLISQSVKKKFTEDDIARYESDIDTLLLEVNAFLGGPKISNLEELEVRDLDQIITRSRVFTGRIDAMQGRLSTVAQDLTNESELLYQNKERWRLTLESQKPEATPASRTERIRRTIQRLDSVRSLLQEDLALIVEGQDALSDRKLKLEELEDDAREMNAVLGKTLLRINMPGFFEDLSNMGKTDHVSLHVEAFKRSFQNDFQVLKADYLRPSVIAAIFLIVVLAFSIWFKKNHARVILEDDFELSETTSTIINFPLATSVILITLMIRLILYELPQTFFYLNVVLLSVPLALFAIRIFGRKIQLWIIVLLVIYDLQILYELAYHPGPLFRIFQMFTCLVELWLFIWLYRMKPFHEEFGQSSLYGLFRGLVLVFAAIPLMGIIANLIGAFRLAEFLSTIPLAIMVAGLAIQVFIRMADSIVYLVVFSRLLQRINVVKDYALVIHKKLVRLIEIFFWLFFLTIVLNIFMVKDAVFAWGERVLTEGKKDRKPRFYPGQHPDLLSC
jgi:hypothetical protein